MYEWSFDNVHMNVKGITVKDGEFDKTFIPVRSIRKVKLYSKPHLKEDSIEVLHYYIHFTYGESALDANTISFEESKEKAEEGYAFILSNL